MERKPQIGARVPPDIDDALERFSDKHGYSKSQSIGILLRESLKGRGYLDHDPLEDLQYGLRVLTITYDLTLLIGVALIINLVSKFAGSPIGLIQQSIIPLTVAAIVLISVNLLIRALIRHQIPTQFREYWSGQYDRLRSRLRRA